MNEGDTGNTAPYSDAARARLVMAYDACVLADLARAAVPIGERELNGDGTTRAPGAVLADAAHVLAAAQRFFESAVVFERTGGAHWQLIGDILGVPAQAARVCFAMAEAGFREEVASLEGTGSTEAGEASCLRAYMVREPLETALDLDDWVLHHEDGDVDLGTTPVSCGLVRTDLDDAPRSTPDTVRPVPRRDL